MSNNNFQLFNGEINNAVYQIAVPTHVEPENIIIYCHGYRPEGIELKATLIDRFELHPTLIERGWIFAATSYRREGYILQDAIEDVINLRNHIVKNHCSAPKKIIAYGVSMGGAVVTLISERYPELFTGMIAVGAALLIRKDPIDNPIKFLNQCQMPSLYLSNYTESSCIFDYKEQCVKKNAPIEPVLYQLGRPGHGVLNLTEYMHAFDALMNWIDNKERPQDEECYVIDVEPERKAALDENGVKFSVSRIDRAYGDIDLDLHSMDLEELGYRPGNTIPFQTSKKGTVNILYSYYPFTGVAHGAWVAAADAYGKMSVWRHVTHTSIEYRYANVDMGVEEGDSMYVPSIPKPAPRSGTRTRVL